jgi:peptidoglycan/LPS O-acetylase OafA/YrhL
MRELGVAVGLVLRLGAGLRGFQPRRLTAGWPCREPLVVSVLFPCEIFLLCCAACRGPITNRMLTNRWIATIGGMCYSITKGIAPFGSYAANLFVQLALAAPLLLIASAGYFALIEKPCMRRDWSRRLFEWLLPLRPAADTSDPECCRRLAGRVGTGCHRRHCRRSRRARSICWPDGGSAAR